MRHLKTERSETQQRGIKLKRLICADVVELPIVDVADVFQERFEILLKGIFVHVQHFNVDSFHQIVEHVFQGHHCSFLVRN